MTTTNFSFPVAPFCFLGFSVFRLPVGAFRCWGWLVLLFLLPGVVVGQQGRHLMADTAVANRLLEEAKALIDFGKYDAALGKLDTAGVILEGTVGEEDTAYAKVLHQRGRCFYFQEDYDRAMEYHQKALEIRLKKLDREHLEVANSYNSLGLLNYRIDDNDRAMEYHQKALKIRLKKLGPEHPSVVHSYNALGNVYHGKGDYVRAIEYHQKALEIRLKKLRPNHPDVAVSYYNLGLVYESKNDYDRMIEYHQRALDIWLINLGPEHLDISRSYQQIAAAQGHKGDYDRAIGWYQKALNIRLKRLGPEHPVVASSYNGLGIAHGSKGDYDLAIEYCQKGLEIRLKKLGSEHPDIARSYLNLANIYFYKDKNNYNYSIANYQKIIEIYLKKQHIEDQVLVDAYNSLGLLFGYKGDYDQAIEHCQKAMEIRLKKIGSGYLDMALYYINIGKFHQLKGSYVQSERCYKKAFLSIKDFRMNLANPASKFTLAKKVFKVYEGGITTNLLLHRLTDSIHYLRDAFDYAEQSKALSLYESMKNTDALHFAGIPDSLLQREYDLRIDITYNQKRKHDLLLDTTKTETDTTVLAISSKLFDLNREYESLVHRFETDYPDYYRLKYDYRTAGLGYVQDTLLQHGQILLEYVVGDSSVFIFAVRKDTCAVVEIKKDFPLEAWTDSLRMSINQRWVATYCRLAHLLYQKLVEPVQCLLTEELIVVPDGVLGYLPFEALLTKRPQWPGNFRLHPYLLRQHHICYCYSATLLREMRDKQHRRPAEKTLLAMAPFYKGAKTQLQTMFSYVPEESMRKELNPLPHTGEEVYGIQKIAGGDVFYHKDATERQFVQSAGDYKILHLATHGQANSASGDYSFLAFTEIKDSAENELLFVRDLYNLQLNADMAVLSACETGIGQLQRGEGIISLARAFAYAGAKSIVTSLWSVEDKASKELMILFYGHLKMGLPKDRALWQAKLDYLNGAAHTEAHPFFWAGFIAIGDMRAIKL